MHTILLVEDDEPAIALMEAIFEPQSEWRLIIARSGRDALELARQERPEVVLLDVLLPDMDGIEVCQLIKSDSATAGIHVLMLSGMANPSTEAEARAAGADEFITKPFSTTKLVEDIERRLSVD